MTTPRRAEDNATLIERTRSAVTRAKRSPNYNRKVKFHGIVLARGKTHVQVSSKTTKDKRAFHIHMKEKKTNVPTS